MKKLLILFLPAALLFAAPETTQFLPPLRQPGAVLLNPARNATYTGENEITVYTAPAVTSEVVFPGAIRKIISSAENELSLETAGNKLFIQPLTEYRGVVFVIADGISFPLAIVPSENADIRVNVSGSGKNARNGRGFIVPSSISRYLKKLFLLDCPDIIRVRQKVFAGNGLEITAEKQLTWPGAFRGYVVQVKNVSGGTVVIPLQEMALPGLAAVAMDKEVLGKGGETTGYLLLTY